jgi:hypothetical protein
VTRTVNIKTSFGADSTATKILYAMIDQEKKANPSTKLAESKHHDRIVKALGTAITGCIDYSLYQSMTSGEKAHLQNVIAMELNQLTQVVFFDHDLFKQQDKLNLEVLRIALQVVPKIADLYLPIASQVRDKLIEYSPSKKDTVESDFKEYCHWHGRKLNNLLLQQLPNTRFFTLTKEDRYNFLISIGAELYKFLDNKFFSPHFQDKISFYLANAVRIVDPKSHPSSIAKIQNALANKCANIHPVFTNKYMTDIIASYSPTRRTISAKDSVVGRISIIQVEGDDSILWVKHLLSTDININLAPAF